LGHASYEVVGIGKIQRAAPLKSAVAVVQDELQFIPLPGEIGEYDGQPIGKPDFVLRQRQRN
jgi:hypothetical protein